MKKLERIHLDVVSLRDIDPGSRFREDYGDLDALAESFELAGMLHDLSVRDHPTGEGNFKYELIAGGRRYWALVKVREKTTSAYKYINVSDEDLRLMEKIENVQRKNPDWKETVRLDAEIHKLQQARHGAPQRRQSPKDGEWTQDDTAKFVGKTQAAVSDSIKLAKALEEHPELANCLKASQARGMMRSIERNKKAKEIARERLKEEEDSSRAKILDRCYIVGDALKGITKVKPEFADLIEIDPPYGIAYNTKQQSISNTSNYTDVAEDSYEDFARTLLTEAYRVAKPNAWCIFWHDIGKTETLRNIMSDVGWKMCKIPLVWNKLMGGALNNPKFHLAHAYEVAHYAYKGTPRIAKAGHQDVFSHLSIRDQYRIHPTERPVDLMVEILSTFTEPGSIVISPFLGSGVTIYAAYECGMPCFGWDLEQSNKDKFLVKCNNWRGYNRKELEDVVDTKG